MMSRKACARANIAAVVCAALFGFLSFDGVVRGEENAPPAASPAAPMATPPSPGADATNPSPTGPATPAPSATPTPPADNNAEPGDSTSLTVDLAARPAAYMEGKSTWDEGYSAITGAIGEIDKELASAGLKPAGRPIGVFLETDDAGFRYRAMAPIEAIPEGKTQLTDAIKFGQTPSGRAMKFEHRGSYEDIDSTYEAITAYLDERGLESQNLFYEEYLNDVKSPEDPTLEVDIYVLLK